jgi:cell division protein FtsL
MARSALAYQQPLQDPGYGRWPERSPRQQSERQLKVLPGKGIDAQNLRALAPVWRRLFAIALVAVFAIGVVWIARVGLTEATMSMLAHSEQVSQSIAAERLAGAQLEVEYSKATNSTNIQEAAANQLGMAADEKVEYLRITPGE